MNNPNELLLQTIARLEYANEQLNRPDEDVIALALCHQARTIIQDLFSAWLLLNDKDISNAPDLATLKKMSVELDNDFAGVNLDGMFCYPGRVHNEKGYCMDIPRVRECISIANQLKDIVLKTTREKLVV